MVWLPGASRETALHKLKLTSAGISLVRLKQRYGIRVATENEKAVHKELRPGDTFNKVEVAFIYRIHPLPHGTQRAQIVKLLADWTWSAKPLQPAKGSQQGGSWDVGASTKPPSQVMHAFGQDVIVTLVKDKKEETSAQSVIGPKRVQTRLQHSKPSSSSSSSNADPWWQAPGQASGHDPWGTYNPVTASPPGLPQTSQKRYETLATQLKTELEADMTTKLAKAAPSLNEQQESRLQKLEVGMNELHAQGQQYSKWFQETGKRLATQDQQLQQLQAGMQQQQSDLQSVRSEVHTSADNLHQAMANTFSSMKSDIAQEVSGSMAAQLEKFEALITGKMQRTS